LGKESDLDFGLRPNLRVYAPINSATMGNQPLIPEKETERLKALRRYEILDTPPDGAFDRITSIAARLFKVPIAIVSLVDSDRIWFKSHHGIDVRQIDREPGLCASAILSDEIYAITDASKDVRSLTNPLVVGEMGLRFYAAAPLRTRDGHNVGTLCVIDKKPRSISLEEKSILTDLAAVVMDEIELRLAAQKVGQLNTELAKAKESAEVANVAKSTFIANMSHELRSPLNVILGFAQLMKKSQSLAPEHRENISIITRSGEHLLTLINQVLNLSKIEAGRTTLNTTNFDLYRLLDDLEDMFQLKADERNLQLIFERSPDVPQYVRTDEVKLRQVLINLLNNAIKFTKKGGVTLKVKSQNPLGAPPDSGTYLPNLAQSNVKSEDNTSSCSFPILNSQLHFEIEDTGSGISPDELETIFEAFVQSQAGRESQEGTGLGLPIARKFVQLMGGEITVSSEVGCGTIFQFDISISIVDTADIEPKPATRRIIALEPNQPRYRILIVDDQWSNRQLLVKLLSPLGFELKEAKNGKEAIEVWDEWKPHLIWMDMRMPVMDGYEATREIKAREMARWGNGEMERLSNSKSKNQTAQSTAIIALTASTFEEEQALVLSAGCDDFVRKPFCEAAIWDAMNKHIGVRYVYDEPANEVDQTQIEAAALTADALAALSNSWITELHQAVAAADSELAFNLIQQIEANHATLAKALSKLVDDFEFEKIESWIAKNT
jgi:signal transduction histidine kinase/CheY-like chemotaxis protein